MAESADRVGMFAEFLDADPPPGPTHAARTESLRRDKYASTTIHLTVALGPQALEFLRGRRESLFL